MARTLYNRFRDEDSTLLFNNRLRGILEAGVYLGYNVSIGGAGGLWLKFSHDPDPDNTGSVLGALVTHDGVTIQESADQDNVCVGSLVAGTPNVHYVVATYTYNQALPANDVVYSVIEGTAGAPPVPPVLNDDQVLIAVIDIPAGCIGYAGAGVDIKTVGKKSLYGSTSYTSTFFKNFDGVLKPGIYDGIEMSVGSGALLVSLSAGCWITNQNAFIPEAANQVDLFTITAPAVGNYKFVWAVGMHKDEDTDPYPDVDYMLVHSADFGIGTAGALPTNAAIRAVAAVVDAKYTTVDDYINKLGVIRIETRVGPTYFIEYIKGETLLQRESVIVYGAQATSLRRSGKYYGYEGLKQAVADIYAITSILADVSETPYEILLDGTFETDDTKLNLPSNIVLKGYSAPAKILSELATTMVAIRGFKATWDTVNPVVVVAGGATPPPAGYNSKTFAIQALYQLGDNFTLLRHSRGDRVNLYSVGGGVLYEGIFVQTLGNWQFEAFMPVAYNGAGNPTDLEMVVVKRNSGLKDVEINGINTGVGKLELYESEKLYLDNLVVNQLEIEAVRDCQCGFIDNINVFSWVGLCNTAWLGGKNHVRHFKTRDTNNTAALQFGSVSYNDTIDYIEYDNPTNVVIFRPEFEYFQCGRLRVNGSGASQVLLWDNQEYGCIENMSATALVRTGSAANLYVGIVATHDLTIEGAGANIIIVHAIASGVIAYTATSPKVRLLSSTQNASQNYGQTLYHSDEDRNLRLVSIAAITWNATTGLLSWDAPLKFDIPWQTGYTQVAAAPLPGGFVLGTDGDRLYLDIDREAAGVVVVVPVVRSKANATLDRFYPNRIFLALRDQNVVYFYDGTRVEGGQTVKVGSTPPPDGSVTWVKLADSATAYHNEVFRDYVSEKVDGFTNDIIFRNTGPAGLVYTPADGKLQYGAVVSLSLVLPGDFVILQNINYQPNVAGQKGYTFEEILSVDDANDCVYITKGLDVNGGLGAGAIWNGAIGRGNKVFTNDALTGYSYNDTTGRLTYGLAMNFTQNQVRDGYLWCDSAGTKFRILAVDAASQWVDLLPNLRNIDTTLPTSKFHGSIELNNNPHNIPVADLHCAHGAEFIPIDSYGVPDNYDHFLINHDLLSVIYNSKLFCSSPYDKRIRLFVDANNRHLHGYEVNDSASNLHMCLGPMGIQMVSFTGYCTGAALVLSSVDMCSCHAYSIDGELFSADALEIDVSYYANTYGTQHNKYMIGSTDFAVATKRAKCLRLPLGVHNIIWNVDPDIVVRGVLVFNRPKDDTRTANLSEAAGTAVQRGGVFTYSSMRNIVTPVNTVGTWDKGGRFIRYIDKLGNKQFASYGINNFDDLGDTNIGVALISNVHNTAQWRVGDIVMLRDTATGLRYLRRITIVNVPGTSLTVSVVIPFALLNCVLYYYGTMRDDLAGSGHERSQESVALNLSILEFAATQLIQDTRSSAFFTRNVPTDPNRANPIGVRLSDCSTALAVSAGVNSDYRGGALLLDTAADTLRFWFVGTGVSVLREDAWAVAGTTTVTIDGVPIDLPPSVNDDMDDPGGTYIAGELPYGQHILTITVTGGGALPCKIKGFTVWQPKKPAIPSTHLPILELADTNRFSWSEAALAVAAVNGVTEVQFGTIQYEAGSICFPQTTNDRFRDAASNVVNDSTIYRLHDWFPGGVVPVGDDCYDFVFFGDEITLVTQSLNIGIGTLGAYWLDHDGTFKVASAVTGFTVVGIDGWVANDAVPGHRWRWVFSELGMHILRIKPIAPCTNAQDMKFDCIEIHTPFHTNRTKQPIATDHTVPLQLCGRDTRCLTPFRSDSVYGTGMVHSQSAIWANDTVGVGEDSEHQYPFYFYTRGGMVDISCSFSVTANLITVYDVGLCVDGAIEDMTRVVHTVAVAADWATMTICKSILLQPGMHFAYLSPVALLWPTAYFFNTIHWKMREMGRLPNSDMDRGSGLLQRGSESSSKASF